MCIILYPSMFLFSLISNMTILSLTLKVSKPAVPNPVRLWTHHRRRRDQCAEQLQAIAATVSRELLPRDGCCAAGSSNPRRQSAGSEGGFLQECNTHRAAGLQREEAWSSTIRWAERRDDTRHSAWGKTIHHKGTAESPYPFLRAKDGDKKIRCFLRPEKLCTVIWWILFFFYFEVEKWALCSDFLLFFIFVFIRIFITEVSMVIQNGVKFLQCLNTNLYLIPFIKE